jgi:hypothetical protein
MRRVLGKRAAFDFIVFGLVLGGVLAAIAWLPDSWAHMLRVAGKRATHIVTTAATSTESLTTALGVLLVVAAEVPIVGYRRSSLLGSLVSALAFRPSRPTPRPTPKLGVAAGTSSTE